MNACGIIASSNFPNTQALEPAGDNQTHITENREHKGKRNTYLNECGIHAYSDVSTYNIQHPTQKDTYINELLNN